MTDSLARTKHPTVSPQEWRTVRDELLAEEKAHTRRGDELARKRLELPWQPVNKDYRLDTDEGERTLTELFDGRSQLLVYHFMFGPSYETGCPVNSSMVDSFGGLVPHLHARDLTMMLVSSASLPKLQAYKRRMGWDIPWASSANSDFNLDLGASTTKEQMREQMQQIGGREVNIAETLEGLPPIAHRNAAACGTDVLSYICETPMVSVFALEDGAVYQTYTTTWRGLEFLMGYYPILDHAPRGRGEGDDDWQSWIRRHDEYGQP
ncbi:DUF899 domain-containing protein [Streptomyces sp. NBC_00286]|uniref:DUF899 domain-containing protein n=1 Tax=Streptomyces sp. NBC_00286 TaxID=2975701 RepID=UPI002E2CF75E|nr:DUF899 domain-containing protein [Streptomyces sp. NBC_00286]